MLKCKRKRGHSLTETLVVLGIIAIMLAILLPAVFNAFRSVMKTVGGW